MRQIIWSIGDMPHMSRSVRSGLRSVCHSETICVGERSAGSTPPPGTSIVPTGVSGRPVRRLRIRSEEHTSELQSLMRISYAVFCLKKKNTTTKSRKNSQHDNNVKPDITCNES